MSSWKNKSLKRLVMVFLSLKNEKDLQNFLRDLCTREELEELSSRWRVVELLNKGLSYRAVAKEVGVSTTTVTRIADWLENGEGGYRAALKGIK